MNNGRKAEIVKKEKQKIYTHVIKKNNVKNDRSIL